MSSASCCSFRYECWSYTTSTPPSLCPSTFSETWGGMPSSLIFVLAVRRKSCIAQSCTPISLRICSARLSSTPADIGRSSWLTAGGKSCLMSGYRFIASSSSNAASFDNPLSNGWRVFEFSAGTRHVLFFKSNSPFFAFLSSTPLAPVNSNSFTSSLF